MEVLISHHAKVRMQQRAISEDMLENLLNFGQIRFNGQGTQILTFPKSVIKCLKEELDHKLFMKAERHLNLYAVMSSDGELITAGYRIKRLKGH